MSRNNNSDSKKHSIAQSSNGKAVSRGAAVEKVNICYILHFSADRQKIAVKYQKSHDLGDIVTPLSAGYGANEKADVIYNQTLRRYYGERVTLTSIGEKNYKTFTFKLKVDDKKTLNVYVVLIFNLYTKGINANTSFRKLEELASTDAVSLSVSDLHHDAVVPESSDPHKINICGHDCAVAKTFAIAIQETMQQISHKKTTELVA